MLWLVLGWRFLAVSLQISRALSLCDMENCWPPWTLGSQLRGTAGPHLDSLPPLQAGNSLPVECWDQGSPWVFPSLRDPMFEMCCFIYFSCILFLVVEGKRVNSVPITPMWLEVSKLRCYFCSHFKDEWTEWGWGASRAKRGVGWGGGEMGRGYWGKQWWLGGMPIVSSLCF